MTLSRKTEQICLVFMTGFSPSGALFRKSVGPLHLFFFEKTGDLFSHHRPRVSCQSPEKLATFFCSPLSFTRGCRPLFRYFGHAKNSPLLLWGPLFVRSNMLNMPKSAADSIPVLGWYTYSNTPWLRLCPERATIIATFYLFYSA